MAGNTLSVSSAVSVIDEELYDKEFVEKWCHDFDRLMARPKDYLPEKAAEITLVTVDRYIR